MGGQLPFLQPAFTFAPSFGANQASSSIFRIGETLIDSSHQGDLGRNSNPTKIRRFSLAPDPHWWEPNVVAAMRVFKLCEACPAPCGGAGGTVTRSMRRVANATLLRFDRYNEPPETRAQRRPIRARLFDHGRM